EQSEKVLCREPNLRSSKPPVTKVKLGLGLEQHELSVIPEVDTPKSSSLSFADLDKTGDGTGEASLISTSGESACMKQHSHGLHGGTLSLGITNYEGKTSSGHPGQTNPSGRLLQELLTLAAESSYDS
ncbi:CE295 protein, partial [Grantiella picta]|nr:CE295 protein [Grantiella picta]